MEALKDVMNTLDVIKEKLTDKEYKEMSDDMKKAYDSFKVGKYIKVLQVETDTSVYWKDVDGDSGITTGQGNWSHQSWKEGQTGDALDESQGGDLDIVEVKTELKQTINLLKIIDDDDNSCGGGININKNTIENSSYSRLKDKKFCHTAWGLIIFIDDCVED
jgi:hypothetical protein